MNSYIFILCPPFCGSTILWKLVSTSSTVSTLPCEGQFIPEVEKIMRKDPWNSDQKLPWGEIKNTWNNYWNQDKPFFLEKSPPNIIRASEIAEYFHPVNFLIMVRNPYAHCEGLIRRRNYDAQGAAEFTVHCLKQQARNAEELKNTLCFTYEELAGDPKSVSQKIQFFLPQIGALGHNQKFKTRSIDGKISRGIVDLNQKKIHNLSITDLKKINAILKRNSNVMNYWGYKYYEPSIRHALLFIKAKFGKSISNLRLIKS